MKILPFLAVSAMLFGSTSSPSALAAVADPASSPRDVVSGEMPRGAGAAAATQGNNRGYVVGKGGVARLHENRAVSDADEEDETAQAAPAPIGVNEPGVNRASKREDGRGEGL